MCVDLTGVFAAAQGSNTRPSVEVGQAATMRSERSPIALSWTLANRIKNFFLGSWPPPEADVSSVAPPSLFACLNRDPS